MYIVRQYAMRAGMNNRTEYKTHSQNCCQTQQKNEELSHHQERQYTPYMGVLLAELKSSITSYPLVGWTASYRAANVR